jgi:serine/threonine protein kinase
LLYSNSSSSSSAAMDTLKKVFSNDPCQKYYTLTRTLGTGSFATVKLAVCKADNTKWAVKVRFCVLQHILCSCNRRSRC